MSEQSTGVILDKRLKYLRKGQVEEGGTLKVYGMLAVLNTLSVRADIPVDA